MIKNLRARRVAVAATAAVTLANGVPTTADASDIQRAYAEHTAACIRLFLTDAQAHANQCLPSRVGPLPIESTSGDNVIAEVPPPPPVVAPPPPPVVETPPPVVDSSYPEVDSSYPEVDSSYPEIDSSYPELAGSYPEVDDSYPEVGSSYPEVDSSHPDL